MVKDSLGCGGPCRAHGCDLCCRETRMSLSRIDVARIREQGHRVRDFAQGHGNRRTLRNVEGRCYFLREGVCTIYASRPAGCRLYPLVYDEARDRGVMDTCCPHRDEFRVEEEDREALRLLVKELR